MKKILQLICIIAVCLLLCGLYWAWKYYVLPERPNRREYIIILERAEKAYSFAKQHNLNEHYALFLNYGIPSGKPRLFVWDFKKKKIVASCYVMHGIGGGSTDKNPVFSNQPGSECSALGHFMVTKDHGSKIKRSFRLNGMDDDNKTAYNRGLMIHGSKYLDFYVWKRYIPLRRKSCQGCVTVTSRNMNYLWQLVNKEKAPLLLWSYNTTISSE